MRRRRGRRRPLLDQIAPAVAAVEAELGGPQQFFEINATPQLVNLFVATDGATQVTPYVYVGGELAPAAEPAGAEGSTFGADALSFDPATMLDAVGAELPDSDVTLFSVAGGPGGAVQYTRHRAVRRGRHARRRARSRRQSSSR